MSLEDILTNRARLSEDILRDVKESATGYGVTIARADVKDLVFPGNLQEIMNRVLAAERMSEAQLIEARTKAEVHKIEARTKAEVHKIEARTKAEAQRVQAQADAEAARLTAQSAAEATRLAVQAEMQALEERTKMAASYRSHPALLRLEELTTLRELARNANARIYLDFKEKPDNHSQEE
jgi:regulator of protease activity HflC (stomatin/prohibitin superfamily)